MEGNQAMVNIGNSAVVSVGGKMKKRPVNAVSFEVATVTVGSAEGQIRLTTLCSNHSHYTNCTVSLEPRAALNISKQIEKFVQILEKAEAK